MELDLTRKNIRTIKECLEHQINEMNRAFEKFPMMKNGEASSTLSAIEEALETLPNIDVSPLSVAEGVVFSDGEVVALSSISDIAHINGLVFAESFIEKYEGKTVYVDKETYIITEVKDNERN